MKTLSRRKFLRLAGLVGGIAALPTAASTYAQQIEPYMLTVERIEVRSPRIPAELDGLKIGMLSDFHLGNGVVEAFMARSVKMLNDLSPDLTVLGGDYVHHSDLGEDAAGALAEIYAPLGVYAIMGNHDVWKGDYAVSTAFEKQFANAPFVFRMLRNDNHTLTIRGAPLHIIGVDDIWENRHRLDHAMRQVPLDHASILLAHEPDYAEQAAAAYPFALQLSGHSHGGQIRIPFVKPWWTPNWAKRHIAGLEDVGAMKLYTSRGVGMSWYQFRFMCPPEVTLITLRTVTPS